ncbi:hypothetical protein P5G60_18420 [Paenibacillus jamilae]|nr:hypothetical protein [Paenibacillus jamilae]
MEINLEKYKFKANNDWYRIGGKQNTVANLESLQCFASKTTADILFSEEFLTDLNKLDFNMATAIQMPN